jgi:hypothetical protein
MHRRHLQHVDRQDGGGEIPHGRARPVEVLAAEADRGVQPQRRLDAFAPVRRAASAQAMAAERERSAQAGPAQRAQRIDLVAAAGVGWHTASLARNVAGRERIAPWSQRPQPQSSAHAAPRRLTPASSLLRAPAHGVTRDCARSPRRARTHAMRAQTRNENPCIRVAR